MSSMRSLLAAAVLALAATTAACAGAGSPVTEPTRTSSPTLTPTPTPTPEPVTATCENTVTAEAAASFAEYKWTARPDAGPLVVGGVTIPDGIACVWGDYSTGNDNVSWLAWGPLDDTSAQTAISALLADGEWRREDGEDGIYITATDTSMSPVTDMDGYAMTYLFADGEVKGALTRADLAIIVAPST